MDSNIAKIDLTERESEIMELVSKGKENKEIADILEIEPGTITKHLQHIFIKLGAKNRTEAAFKFLEMTGRIILVAV
jgi:DNA-binding NarL/FixJ family response regulator